MASISEIRTAPSFLLDIIFAHYCHPHFRLYFLLTAPLQLRVAIKKNGFSYIRSLVKCCVHGADSTGITFVSSIIKVLHLQTVQSYYLLLSISE